MLESLEGKRGVVRAKPPIPAHRGPLRQARPSSTTCSPWPRVPTILADGAAGLRGARRRPLARHPGVPARRQHRPRRHRRDRVRHHPAASWSNDYGGGTAHRPPDPRRAGRRAARRVPAASTSSTCRSTTRRSPRPARCSATAASWCSTTPSTWPRRPASRWSSAPRSPAASARPCRVGAVRGVEVIDQIIAGDRPRASNLVAARRPVRGDDRRIAVRDGRADADAGAQRPDTCRRLHRDATSQRRPTQRQRVMTLLNENAISEPRPRPGDGAPVDGARSTAIAGDGARGHLGDARGRAGRHRRPEAVRDRHPRGVRLVPAVPGRDRRRDAARPRRAPRRWPTGMKVQHADAEARAAAPRRHGALHLRPPARLPHLPGQRRLRAAGHGRRGRPARRPLRLRRRQPPRRRRRTRSNPYFDFDPAKCIVCSRCVRACDEVQGTFALTIEGRGFDSQGLRRRRRRRSWTPSACRAARACRRARPRRCRRSRSSSSACRPARVLTTCAYCGVGCSFKAELQGDERRADGARTRTAAPTRATRASRAASPAATPATPTACSKPMMREHDHRRVARGRRGTRRSASRPRRHARDPGPSTAAARSAASPRRAAPTKRSTSSRRWCAPRSATTTSTPAPGCATRPPATASSRRSARRPARRTSSRSTQADVIVVIGANPTDAHPVFASRMKRRLREGAKLDRGRPAPHRPGAHAARRGRAPPAARAGHQRRGRQRDGPRRRHRGPGRPARSSTSAARTSTSGRRSSPGRRTARRPPRRSPACRPPTLRAAARLYATGGNAAIYYGLGVTEHSQGSTMVMGMANLAHGHRQHRPRRRRRQPAARPEQRAGLVRHGFVPARAARLPARLRRRRARHLRGALGHARCSPSPGCASPTCSTRPSTAHFRACSCRARTSRSPTPTPRTCTPRSTSLELLVVQDLFLNETAKFAHVLPARHVVPGEGRHVHQRRAPHQPGAPGDAAATGKHEWQIVCEIAQAMGYPMALRHDRARSWTRSPLTTPTFAGVSLREARRSSAACSGRATRRSRGHADHARERLRARQRPLHRDAVRAHRRAQHPQVPADPDHRPHPHPVQRRRADPPHRQRARGTPRTSSRSTRTTPRSAASATATR